MEAGAAHRLIRLYHELGKRDWGHRRGMARHALTKRHVRFVGAGFKPALTFHLSFLLLSITSQQV